MILLEKQQRILIAILIGWIVFSQLLYIDKLLLAKDEYIASCEAEITRLQGMLKQHHVLHDAMEKDKNSP